MARRSADISERLRIDVYVDGSGMLESMADDVRKGLTSDPKRVSPKFFYDYEGSVLFERITELPEYYPTRAERDLLAEISDELMATLRPEQVVELGSGSSSKTRLLLGAESAPTHLKTYVPFDVSKGIVEEAANQLLDEFPFLSVHGVIGDFSQHLDRIPETKGRRLVLFLGGTIGNFAPAERQAFLRQVAAILGPDDRLLIGMDLVKDPAIIEAAYNDSQGVTAEFNRNVLRVLNQGVGADFNPEAYGHRAYFNRDESRIEMHLVPASTQMVTLRDLGMTITISPDETLWTESSYKFTEESVNDMLEKAGLRLDGFYTNEDPSRLFGLALAAPID
jgi:L-histidine N-alpha-methyltransferase